MSEIESAESDGASAWPLKLFVVGKTSGNSEEWHTLGYTTDKPQFDFCIYPGRSVQPMFLA